MIDRTFLGFSTQPSRVVLDQWHVKLFCEAIGESHPVCTDLAGARAAGHPACLVPPTFLKALEINQSHSATLLDMLGVAVRFVLHAEQSFEYLAPVHVGDEIELTRRFSDTYDKKGGALSFIVFDSRFCRASVLVATSRQLIVVHNQSA